MQTDTSFNLSFTFHDKLFCTSAKQANYPDGYTIYHLKFAIGQYYFLHRHGIWKVVSDISPCEKLKSRIIEEISKQQAANQSGFNN